MKFTHAGIFRARLLLLIVILLTSCLSVLVAQSAWDIQSNKEVQVTIPYLSQSETYTVVQSFPVRWNRIAGKEQLQIDLGQGKPEIATLMKEDVHRNGSYSWIGRLSKHEFGYCILSYAKGTYWGKVETDEGKVYLVVPTQTEDVYALVQVEGFHHDELDCLKPPIDKVRKDDGPQQGSMKNSVPNVCDTSVSCSPLELEVFVAYSDDARVAMGGTTASEAAIANAVSEMNLINLNSNVIHTYTLVHTMEVQYTEAGDFAIDLDHLRENDGVIDNVLFEKEKYYGDVVELILASGGCGIASVNTNPTNFSAGRSYGVTSVGCMIGNKTFAHEIGHNMGLRHDRYVNTGTPVCSWSYGFVNPNANGGNANQRWRTVMAYNRRCSDWGFNCFRVNHWSNPNVSYNGDPTGSPLGTSTEASSQTVLNRSICKVDSFRQRPNCNNCMLFSDCAVYNPNTDNGPGNFTEITVSDNFPTAVASDLIELCVTTRGDQSINSETFNIISESSNILGQSLFNDDCDEPTRVCFSISVSDYNAWIADGTITVNLDPISTLINPDLCSAGLSRGCVEVLFTPGTSCPDTIIFATHDSSGVFQASQEILSNAQIGSGLDILYQAGQGVLLQENFEVQQGAIFEVNIAVCGPTLRPFYDNEDAVPQVQAKHSIKSPIITGGYDPSLGTHVVEYYLPNSSSFTLYLYDYRSQKYISLQEVEEADQGYYQFVFPKESLLPGTYLLRLESNSESVNQQIYVKP